MKRSDFLLLLNFLLVCLICYLESTGFLDFYFLNSAATYCINFLIACACIALLSRLIFAESLSEKTSVLAITVGLIVLLAAAAARFAGASSENRILYLSALALLTMFGCIAVSFKKIVFTPSVIAAISVSAAMSYTLSFLKVWQMPQGGSVSLAMIPLLLAAYMYGPQRAAAACCIYGIVDFLMQPDIVHPIQIFLDYQLAFICIAASGFFSNSLKRFLLCGIPAAFFLRFCVHTISGAVYFSSYAPEGMSPLLYSALYNAAYLVPEMLLSALILSGIKNRFRERFLQSAVQSPSF